VKLEVVPSQTGATLVADLLDQLRILKDGLASADGRIEELFSSCEIGVCLIDAAGRFQRVNPAWETCLGHPTDGIVGQTFTDFVHPDDRKSTQLAAARLQTEATVRFWNRFRQSDGNYTTLQWAASQANSEGGICAVAVASGSGATQVTAGPPSVEAVLDATGLGAAPAELYRSVVETSPDAILVTDLTGRVLIVNEQAVLQNGLETADQLLGLNAFDIVSPEDRARAAENARLTLETGSVRNVEYELLRRDGVRMVVELSASLVRNPAGQPCAFIATVRDITERKRAAEAHRETEERYRILYQDNPSMYFTVDAGGTVLSVNQFGAEQLGYRVEELLGKPVLGVFFEEDKQAVAKQLAVCVQRPREVHHWEFRKVRKDGRVIWVREAARATTDANGETIVLIVCEDITERRMMEEELQRAREALENKVERQMVRGRAYGLTFREMTVLHLVSAGSADKDIAEKLGISPLTVSKHVANVLTKMGAATRSEASARAVRESIVE
jgi:PAS domain S-box-containing protein